MRRVYVPNPVNEKLEEAKKQLYLLKTALTIEKEEKINIRIDKIRKLLVEISETLDRSDEGG